MIGNDFSPYLLPGERVQWSGKPRQGIGLTAADLFLVPFSLLWGGFTVFWEIAAIRERAGFFFELWGVPFVLAGVYLIAGRFFVDAWARRNTVYALTDKRVLIVRAGPFGKVTALSLSSLPPVELSEQSNGRGTIAFSENRSRYGSRGFSGWSPGLSSNPSFIGIENARDVFARLQGLIQKARP